MRYQITNVPRAGVLSYSALGASGLRVTLAVTGEMIMAGRICEAGTRPHQGELTGSQRAPEHTLHQGDGGYV